MTNVYYAYDPSAQPAHDGVVRTARWADRSPLADPHYRRRIRRLGSPLRRSVPRLAPLRLRRHDPAAAQVVTTEAKPVSSCRNRHARSGERPGTESTMGMREAIRSLAVGALLVRERWESGVSYNPLSPEMAQDPTRPMRSYAPATPCSSRLMRLAFSHIADVDTILATTGTSPASPRNAFHPRAMPAFERRRRRDAVPRPAEITRGSLVNKAFTPRSGRHHARAAHPRAE